ncbi:hypothetical protein BDF22DRAFT_701608, partial [Syncephalis plumigaleata]
MLSHTSLRIVAMAMLIAAIAADDRNQCKETKDFQQSVYPSLSVYLPSNSKGIKECLCSREICLEEGHTNNVCRVNFTWDVFFGKPLPISQMIDFSCSYFIESQENVYASLGSSASHALPTPALPVAHVQPPSSSASLSQGVNAKDTATAIPVTSTASNNKPDPAVIPSGDGSSSSSSNKPPTPVQNIVTENTNIANTNGNFIATVPLPPIVSDPNTINAVHNPSASQPIPPDNTKNVAPPPPPAKSSLPSSAPVVTSPTPVANANPSSPVPTDKPLTTTSSSNTVTASAPVSLPTPTSLPPASNAASQPSNPKPAPALVPPAPSAITEPPPPPSSAPTPTPPPSKPAEPNPSPSAAPPSNPSHRCSCSIKANSHSCFPKSYFCSEAQKSSPASEPAEVGKTKSPFLREKDEVEEST